MICMTDFASGRHFGNPDFGGTKIPGTPALFVEALKTQKVKDIDLVDGYAPFCKHLFVENFTEAFCGIAEITQENNHLLYTGYKARRDTELPVLCRWFNAADVEAVKAPYLDVILYSASQLLEEGVKVDGDWGIVSINSAMTACEGPMNPMTLLRNALGKDEGGSGVPLDKDEYTRSLEYWGKYATIGG